MGKMENEIKLQWYKPDINPHAAKKYELQKRTRHERRSIISTTDKLSAVAAGLEPNTKYWFRVHAINGVPYMTVPLKKEPLKKEGAEIPDK